MWREEDPRSRNNFTLGFTLHAKISAWCPSREGLRGKLKMAGDKNKNAIWALLLSSLASINYYLSAEL